MTTIGIVDYGMGNLGSILNMMRRLGANASLVSNPEDISRADKLILPGVGAFDHGMRNLEERGLRQALDDAALHAGKPVLGICLGMQLMGQASEEGTIPGLGWIPASVKRFVFAEGALKVPHMGWNTVVNPRPNILFSNMWPESRFYFVHSYYVDCQNAADVIATTSYGVEFVSAFQLRNIMGVQFHPEKSHKFGMRLLSNFVGAA